MIRSTKIKTSLANNGKLVLVESIIEEYTNVVRYFVDIFWGMDKVPTFVNKEIAKPETWLSATMIQCAGKQASGIVRGTRKKNEQRLYVYNKLLDSNQIKKAKKLKTIIESNPYSKPNLKNLEIDLDSRFITFSFESTTKFNGWVTITSIGNKIKLSLPFNRNKHLNNLKEKGTLKPGIRLSAKNMTLMFDIEDTPKKETGDVLGIDVGQLTTISCSNGHQSTTNRTGHDLSSIAKRLSRKKKGSKGFQREQSHRTNYINWTINQLDLSRFMEIKVEKIRNLRKGKNSSRSLSHWTYTEIFAKVRSKCEETGVLFLQVNPTYTSQRCSSCGFTRKINRKGKTFKCTACFFEADADLNASVNISLKLKPIGKQQRLKQLNRTGFYWIAEGQEPTVPDVQKVNFTVFQ